MVFRDGCLVSSRAETLNKAIASGSQKVNVDVVQQRDYSRREQRGSSRGGQQGEQQGVCVGGWAVSGPGPFASRSRATTHRSMCLGLQLHSFSTGLCTPKKRIEII